MVIFGSAIGGLPYAQGAVSDAETTWLLWRVASRRSCYACERERVSPISITACDGARPARKPGTCRPLPTAALVYPRQVFYGHRSLCHSSGPLLRRCGLSADYPQTWQERAPLHPGV